MKISCISLGCPKNRVDSEKMLGKLLEKGWEITSPENAEFIIVNTCAFLKEARKESEQVINQFIQDGKRIIVAGCLPVYYGKALKEKFSGLYGSLGPGDLDKIGSLLQGNKPLFYWNTEREETMLPRFVSTSPFWEYLKIGEGCDNFCSYCIIPRLRGKFMSYRKELILSEATVLTACGIKELILVSQDTAMYGKDIYGKPVLPELLQDLSQLEGLEWIRIMYVHPAHLDERIVESIAKIAKVTKYIDLPIQHCNKEILKKMNRKINKDELIYKLEYLRKEIPQITIRTSIIVGFPGEGEKEFKELLEFLKEAQFERLGVFCFSREEGTPAAEMEPQVSEKEKEIRQEEVYRLQEEISYKKNLEKLNKQINVLVEEKTEEGFVGRSESDAPEIDQKVVIRGNAKIGEIIPVLIDKITPYNLEGSAL